MSIKEDIKNFPSSSGVYQMFDEQQKILYVGKAKNLKKRVGSYFRSNGLNAKTLALVKHIHSIQVTITQTEIEALILEHNLIKQQRPPYNILLRDDKSYPYIFLSDDEYPRIGFYRGAKSNKGQYFGPYPNSHAAREALSILQKAFRVRQCENSYFRNRSRPCLQYQIKRCSGPCVEMISTDKYAEDVENSRRFLNGQDEELMNELVVQMNQQAQQQHYEQAAQSRDQISYLRSFLSEQVIEKGKGNMDIIAVARTEQHTCVHLLFIRKGRIMGSRSHYPKDNMANSESEILEHFIPYYYLGQGERHIPDTLLIGHFLQDQTLLSEALKQSVGHKVMIEIPHRGRRKSWLKLATETAEQNLLMKQSGTESYQRRWHDLQEHLQLEEPIEQMECYDISHTQGQLTVASCVVFNQEGPANSLYRRFNIEGITPGDDYAAMQQVLQRRFNRLQKESSRLPDIVVIDGGKGQLSMGIDVMNELGIHSVTLIGVSKGPARKSGEEKLYCGQQDGQNARPLDIDPTSPAFHLVQNIRDEAHRFAISGHRQRRAKQTHQSPLSQISGIGPQRRKALLQHFGGLQAVTSAGIGDLQKVKGISKAMAESIYRQLH